MYKITETTTVTITVAPGAGRLYTHAMMSNGNHYARALTTDIDLGLFVSGMEEYQLNNLRAADDSGKLYGYVLDLINVTVVGSIYDDTR